MQRPSVKKPKQNVKLAVVQESFKAIFHSKFLIFLLLSTFSIAWARWRHTSASSVIPLVFLAVFAKSLVFEAIIIYNSVQMGLGLFDWFNLVDDKLYLGAIPLESQFKSLMSNMGIEAVLSVVEDFEISSNTAVGRPIQITDYKQAGLHHLHLPWPDFHSPPFKLLDRGADFIDKHLSERRKVYCHCKSGKGRSACMIMAYFMKHKYLDANTAFSLMKNKRKAVFGNNSFQMNHMIKYGAYLSSDSQKSE